MPTDDFIFNLIGDLPSILIRLFIVILLFMHILVSLIILKQTRNMIKIVEAQISPTIYFIAVTHLLASIAVLVWVILTVYVIPV